MSSSQQQLLSGCYDKPSVHVYQQAAGNTCSSLIAMHQLTGVGASISRIHARAAYYLALTGVSNIRMKAKCCKYNSHIVMWLVAKLSSRTNMSILSYLCSPSHAPFAALQSFRMLSHSSKIVFDFVFYPVLNQANWQPNLQQQ